MGQQLVQPHRVELGVPPPGGARAHRGRPWLHVVPHARPVIVLRVVYVAPEKPPAPAAAPRRLHAAAPPLGAASEPAERPHHAPRRALEVGVPGAAAL
jgi:hypothetical protein